MKLHELKIQKKHIGKCFKAQKDYIVYKHVYGYPKNGIAILCIPKGTRIVCAKKYGKRNPYSPQDNRKLRAEKAYCIGIIPFENGVYQSFLEEDSPIRERFYSMKHCWYEYEVGKELTPNQLFSTYVNDFCRSGIHFFASLKDAEKYTRL